MVRLDRDRVIVFRFVELLDSLFLNHDAKVEVKVAEFMQCFRNFYLCTKKRKKGP